MINAKGRARGFTMCASTAARSCFKENSVLKDLLVPMTRAEGDETALQVAIDLAARSDAHLAVLIPVSLPVMIPSEWGTYPTDLYSGAYDEARRQGEALAETLRARLARLEVASEVRVVESQYMSARRIAALHARHADLTVITAPTRTPGHSAVESLFLDVLMESGRPVLVVAPGYRVEVPAKRAVIAWQPTREASRAVHDALPLLRNAELVDVLTVDPEISEAGHGEQPGADLATHLARHGLNVRVVSLSGTGESIARSILGHCIQTGAGLLVAGGYSHSRFREIVVGGVTRDLLAAAHLPILFSH
jgi:nucleotide-binding universal stress UspA family protein